MAAKKGTQFQSPMSNEHRTKIGNSQILKRLIGHAEGTVEMSTTQVTAGLGLMKKVLPDLSNVSIEGSITIDPLNELLREVAAHAKRIDKP